MILLRKLQFVSQKLFLQYIPRSNHMVSFLGRRLKNPQSAQQGEPQSPEMIVIDHPIKGIWPLD